ncbi:Cache 3/Cache 2 fusion domain-containing protein [bacterium]|nr:Cache 3/Cache 2 fusion domain-containing protein [candidate division CSSED10-310 bacterium]
MAGNKIRLIPWSYRIIMASLTVVVFIVSFVLVFYRLKPIFLFKASESLVQSAGELRNLARQRHDLIRIYQIQDENQLRLRLQDVSDFIADVSRQVELAAARRTIHLTDARNLVLQAVVTGNFGNAAYGYIIDESGMVIYHPLLPEKFDLSRYHFIQRILARHEGVERYTWKVPGDPEERERMVAFRTLYSWDWVLCVEVPLADALDQSFEAQQLTGFYEFIRSARLRWRGYYALVSEDGQCLAYPTSMSTDITKIDGGAEILACREGVCSYKDAMGRRWWAGVAYFKPRGWILAATALEDDILESYRGLQIQLALALTAMWVVLLVVLFHVMRRLALRIHQQVRKPSNNTPSNQ